MRALPLLVALAVPALAGCLAQEPLDPASVRGADGALALPELDYYQAEFVEGRGFHTLEEIEARILDIAAARPDLAEHRVIGTSVQGRPIHALVLTDPAVPGPKLAPLIDGGHHANEVEGIEVSLFLADFLVANRDHNATVRALLEDLEIWVVPVVNPDGYVAQTRHNANQVNLNRNYDLDWCDPLAYNTCVAPTPEPLVPIVGPPPEYAGSAPFSEPESRAVRDLVLGLGDRLAFYLSHHTDVHCITAPWTAPQPPFPVPEEHGAVIDAVFTWVEANTEYGAGGWTWVTGECMSYSAGGTSMDWAYAAARKPSFTFEVGGSESREGAGVGKPLTFLESQSHGDLPHWVRASLPVHLLMLHNAQRLAAWEPALLDPPLPEAASPSRQ